MCVASWLIEIHLPHAQPHTSSFLPVLGTIFGMGGSVGFAPFCTLVTSWHSMKGAQQWMTKTWAWVLCGGSVGTNCWGENCGMDWAQGMWDIAKPLSRIGCARDV